MAAIEAEGIEFSFGALRVLRGVTLLVESGSMVSVLGPNGAGKTTLLKILAGLLQPQKGQVCIGGVNPRGDPAGYRKLIGVISHQPYVYPQLTGRENLEFYGRLFGVDDVRAKARRTLEEMGLGAAMDRETSTYSRGMLQRLAVGRALLHGPRVLLLDEPFTGLDHEARSRLEILLGGLGEGGRTVVMTTHDIEGGLGLSGRLVVLSGGGIVLDVAAGSLDRSTFRATYEEAVARSRSGEFGCGGPAS
jgi:heme exporter protein A